MTDTMLSLTGLTEAAKAAGVTTDQARTILEAAGVKVQPEKPALPTEPGDVIIATEVRGETGKWRMFRGAGGHWFSAEPIDPHDVREGDRVRVELSDGTVICGRVNDVDSMGLASVCGFHVLLEATDAPSVRLLHREEA